MPRTLKNTAPQLAVNESSPGFGWVDGLVLLALMGLLWSALHFGKGMLVHFDAASVPQVDTSPSQVPYYAGRTLLRMWIAFACSLFFAFSVGYLEAKNRAARAIILPALDVLQSVPVLGFLSATVAGSMALFPGRSVTARWLASNPVRHARKMEGRGLQTQGIGMHRGLVPDQVDHHGVAAHDDMAHRLAVRSQVHEGAWLEQGHVVVSRWIHENAAPSAMVAKWLTCGPARTAWPMVAPIPVQQRPCRR